MTVLFFWTTGLSYFYLIEGEKSLEIDPAIPAILGTAISLFLGFVTTSAYDRWWEARKLWGAIVNDSRTWTRQVQGFVRGSKETETHRELVYGQIAFCYAFGKWLRNQDPLTAIGELLPRQIFEDLQDSAHIPNSILHWQGMNIRKLSESNQITDFQYVEMEGTLLRLTNHMGGCERIKKTVFPKQYSFFIHLLIVVFMFMLPLGLIYEFGWLSILLTLGLGFLFLLMETIETNMQDPFENRANDTAMTAISRTIDINLRQVLGETDLPEPIADIKGILY